MRVFVHQRAVDLPPDTFVADGGEAVVHAIGDVAYKVFHQPIDPARLRALTRLHVPGALLPDALLTDDQGRCVGHTMPFLPRSVPWARLLARSYCDRHGIAVPQLLRLVARLRDRVEAVHRAGALVVDLHEGNILLDEHHDRPVLVDTSSWQLPGHPATAIQQGVRDRHSQGFDEGTDWFSFAVVTLHLLLGIHPYRGTHPRVKGLDERMFQRLSVLCPEVRRPAVCRPDDVVPSRWRRWYRAVLDGDTRGPPPTGPLDTITWTPRPSPTARRLTLDRLLTAPDEVLEAAEAAGVVAVRTARGVSVGPHHYVGPAERVVITPEGDVVAAWRAGGRLHLHDVARAQAVGCQLAADALTVSDGALVVRSGPRLVELRLQRLGERVHALPHLLATVLREATELFDGLAFENLLGRTHLRLLSRGRCDTVAVPFLDGTTVLDAHHHAGVVVLLARRDGRTDRWVLRRTGAGLDTRHTEDVEVADVELVRLPTGVCLLRTGARLEIFRDRPGDPDVRTLEDPVLGHGRLVGLDGTVGFVAGREVHRLRLRP